MTRTQIRAAAVAAVALCLLVLAAHGRSLSAGFVSYDDEDYVTGNRHVLGGLSAEGAAWAVRSVGYASNWHPLTWLSHMADVSLFGLRPWGHHLTSLVLHLGNTLALFALLMAMTGAVWRSLLAAALFGVHPLHVESVAWVAERKDVLAAFFWMLALLSWVRWTRRRSPAMYGAAVVCHALGLAAKPMVVSLPLVLLLLDWWPLGRVGSADRAGGRGALRLLGEKVPLLALSAASGWVTWLAQQRGGATGVVELALWARAANAAISYGAYLLKALVPVGLSPFYPHQGSALALWKPAAAGLSLCAATWLVLRGRDRRPHRAAGWSWYLVTLLPVAGIVQVGWQAMADRYTYLPLIGPFVMVSWELGGWAAAPVPTRARRRATLTVAAAVWLLTLSAASWVQTGYWRDTTTLFERALAVSGRNWLAEHSLGNERLRQGLLFDAERRFRRAVELNPSFADAHNNLGAVLMKQGRFREALPAIERAASLSPGDALLRFNLGLALERSDPARAAREYREALRLRPDFPEARIRLAIVERSPGR